MEQSNEITNFNEVFNYNFHYRDLKICINNKNYDFIKDSLYSKILNNGKAKVTAVYFIKNSIDGKFYIGSCKNVSNRISSHKMFLTMNKHKNSILQESFNRTNKLLFDVCVIFINDRDEAYDVEQYLLNFYKDDNNLCNKAIDVKASGKGMIVSSKSRSKMRLAKLGGKASNETKQRMSLSQRNRVYTDEQKSQLKINSQKRIYTTLSNEHKKKLSIAGMGRKLTANHIEILKNGQHIKRTPVIINNIEYNSVREARDKLGIKGTTIYRKLNDKNITNYNYKI